MSARFAERNAWVVLGGVHLLNQTAPRRVDDPIVLVRVEPQEIAVPGNTVIVRWDDLGACPAQALTVAGDKLSQTRVIAGADLFFHGIAGPALHATIGTTVTAALVPLCYLAEAPGGYHAYAPIHFFPEDACFVRSTPSPVGTGPVEDLRWLEPVLEAHNASVLQLNNHRRYYRTHFAGTELEVKYNLTAGTDIWAASMDLLKTLRTGGLDGCRPEFRDEFQANFTENHLFDVMGPETEVGYASFVRTVSGGHVLKRKWYTEDAFARREELSPVLDVAQSGFEEHLRGQLGLKVRAMPPFRRVRYDVHCESMATGHVYGIFFDHCSLMSAPHVVLSQCELEYRRTRGIVDQDPEGVMREMERIDSLLLGYLTLNGLADQRTFYSKRSFLRDAVTAHPELASLKV
ncbi:hypothetical protein OHS33_38810 (plasmid) [Streptomyces sp. NBC_00536]|uniref:hypothetical protein n=1 Tax=Streptomyces sp. NBC_00536 TaxID=2975769 RepID=UPI002E7FF3BA|nr:hypothetical protein [Streptomyces sp. NBC_00536]WUC84455.1 hypothetical protein OHS33_38810 [Streptomyces sp. NBC_00536]